MSLRAGEKGAAVSELRVGVGMVFTLGPGWLGRPSRVVLLLVG